MSKLYIIVPVLFTQILISSSTPTEIVWIFDSALTLWACLRFARIEWHNGTGTGTAPGPIIRQFYIGWNITQSLDEWILTGQGRIVVQGLGHGSDISVEAILRGAIERLDAVSWGLAGIYREVLRNLLVEEKRGRKEE